MSLLRQGLEMAESSGCDATSKGQVTTPKLIQQQLGLHRGSRDRPGTDGRERYPQARVITPR